MHQITQRPPTRNAVSLRLPPEITAAVDEYALALSIMAGKADNAKVLIEHGASFEEVPDPEIIAAEFDEKKKKRFAQYLKFAYEDFRKRSKDSAVLTLEKSNSESSESCGSR